MSPLLDRLVMQLPAPWAASSGVVQVVGHRNARVFGDLRGELAQLDEMLGAHVSV